MFGRTARKGKPGMVQMILHKEHLDEPYRDQPVNIMRYRREEMEKERILGTASHFFCSLFSPESDATETVLVQMISEGFSPTALFAQHTFYNCSSLSMQKWKRTSWARQIYVKTCSTISARNWTFSAGNTVRKRSICCLRHTNPLRMYLTSSKRYQRFSRQPFKHASALGWRIRATLHQQQSSSRLKILIPNLLLCGR